MAKDQKVTLTFDMTDNTRKTVAFTVPAGKDGKDGKDGTNGKDGTDGVGIIDITATQEDITD
jgi:hypothetical protein